MCPVIGQIKMSVCVCVWTGRQLRPASAVEGADGEDVLSRPSAAARGHRPVLRLLLGPEFDGSTPRTDSCRGAEDKR